MFFHIMCHDFSCSRPLLLGIDDGHQVVASQITSRCQTREAATNNQHTTPWPTNKLYQIDDKNTDRVHEIAKRNQITSVKTTGSLFEAEFALSCNRNWITFAEKEFLSSYELQDVTSNNSAGRNMPQPRGMTKTALPVLQFQSRWGFNCEGGMITTPALPGPRSKLWLWASGIIDGSRFNPFHVSLPSKRFLKLK